MIASAAAAKTPWPSLPRTAWRDTFPTLHMWLQIIGKTRLALAPMENHWWQVPLYLTPRGLTTSVVPYGNRGFAVDVDFIAHRLVVETSDGTGRELPLTARSVADFYAEYMSTLRALSLEVRIRPVPVEIVTAIPFAEDREHASYDPEAANLCWQMLAQADRVMKRFRGRFQGKASPVHFFWGSFDMAATRFSGRPAPRHPGGVPNCPDYVMVEAYAQECSSCGFWPGDGAATEPAFYAYAYPEPPGYAQHPMRPAEARYSTELREFVLPYAAARAASDPDAAVLEFFQAAYDAAADLARWERERLDRPVVSWPR